MSKRTLAYGLLCCAALLLAACGTTPTPLPLPTGVPVPTATAGAYEPLPAAECTALQEDVSAVLGVPLEQTTAPFVDYIAGEGGTCCQLVATGTGATLGTELAVTSNLQFLLEDQGWIVDMQYAAGGPTGSAFGMRQDERLALVSVMWTPSADANCPDDQPISACNLTPEQMLFTIIVQAAQK